ncbi:hypothetical protein chiPu_0026399, partial [Chiloscyllium punctatum]|nr:hypothetical protein [Chiloscyllium punctatum]
MRDLSVCGYYEPTNAAVISLYLCFLAPSNRTNNNHDSRDTTVPLSEAEARGDWYYGRRGKSFMITSDTISCWSIYRASGYRNIAQHSEIPHTPGRTGISGGRGSTPSGIAVLETHAHTINRLIDRERENTAHIQEGQLCHAYGLWMVAQIRHNLDQIQRGEVPDWIDNTKLASLAGRSGTLDSRTLKGMTRVYPVIPDCEVSEATGVGMVLLIPVVTPGSGPFPLFHIENIGVIRENASLKYIMAHDTANSRDGAVYVVPLAGCKQRGAITICPHPLQRSETEECGFNRTQGCTLEIEPTGPHFTRAGYCGRGQYCVSTLEMSFWFNGLQCPIPQHELCFIHRRPVTIGQAHILEVRLLEPKSVQATDEFRNTLREYQEPEQAHIPHLAEILRELRTRAGHPVKLYHQLQAHIKDL